MIEIGSTLLNLKLENVCSGKLNSSADDTLKNRGLLFTSVPFNDMFVWVLMEDNDVGARWQKSDSEIMK